MKSFSTNMSALTSAITGGFQMLQSIMQQGSYYQPQSMFPGHVYENQSARDYCRPRNFQEMLDKNDCL